MHETAGADFLQLWSILTPSVAETGCTRLTCASASENSFNRRVVCFVYRILSQLQKLRSTAVSA